MEAVLATAVNSVAIQAGKAYIFITIYNDLD